MTTVRESVICLLRELGMTTIFGNPGSTELPLFRHFPDTFRYVLGLQESVVVGMADGYAQATRNAAFVNLHSAAGVGHAMGNIFTAFRNRTPMVITAGQQARSILPYEPFLYSQQASELPYPYVKWAVEPARGEDVPGAIARAYYLAMQAPCGPTFVSIPVDDWDRPAEPVPQRSVSRTTHPDPALIAALGDALDRSARPVFVVGAGVDRDEAWDAVVTLAERHEALVWTSPMSSRCSFPERHRLFAGFLPPMRERIVESLSGHDIVVVLGAQVFTYHIEGFGPHVPPGAALFQVIDDPQVAAWTPTGTSIVGSVRAAAEGLLARPAPAPRTRPQGRVVPPLPATGDGISLALLMKTIGEVRPEDSIIVEESPSSRRTMQTFMPIDRPSSFFTCASGGLGHSMPAAVGVALARSPSQRIVGILGDGSAMYSIQSLWSAADLRLPITFIIVNNGGYAALNEFSSHFNITKLVGTELPGIDFVGLARAMGCEGLRIDRPDQLAATLRDAMRSPRPIVVDVIVK
jgi:benzoylformate decarboxylase